METPVNTRQRLAAQARHGEAGFNMIEMLMAAFVLAIGILGLTLLQTMSIRSQAGSKALTTATQIGERLLDAAQSEGRQSLIFARNGQTPRPPVLIKDDPFTTKFPVEGDVLPAGKSSIKADFFRVELTSTDESAPIPLLGGIRVVNVKIEWDDNVQPGATKAVARTARFTRRIAYATEPKVI